MARVQRATAATGCRTGQDRQKDLSWPSRPSAAKSSPRNAHAARPSGPPLPNPKRRKSASSKRIIVIDPGHGGIDPGCRRQGPGSRRRTYSACKFSKTLKRKLEASGRYKVLMTRSQDTYISLRKRVEFGRQNGADLFISVHADAIPWSKCATRHGRRGLHAVGRCFGRGGQGACREREPRGHHCRCGIAAGVERCHQHS